MGTDRNGERGYFPRDWVELVANEDVGETGEAPVEGGVGRKAGSVLGLVPPRDGAVVVGGARKKSRFAAFKGWGWGKG